MRLDPKPDTFVPPGCAVEFTFDCEDLSLTSVSRRLDLDSAGAGVVLAWDVLPVLLTTLLLLDVLSFLVSFDGVLTLSSAISRADNVSVIGCVEVFSSIVSNVSDVPLAFSCFTMFRRLFTFSTLVSFDGVFTLRTSNSSPDVDSLTGSIEVTFLTVSMF